MPDRLGAMSETTTSTGRPPSCLLQLGQHLVLAKVALQEGHALDRLECEHVERDDGAVQRARGRRRRAGGPAELAPHVLAPGARRRAQVDDQLAGLEQVQLLVDLLQLVGGAGAVALASAPASRRDR